MSQEIKKARLREIAQQYHECEYAQRADESECGAIMDEKIVLIAHKRVKEGLGAVRD